MIGASKILTVSYGTFSCTLEGFDEPFNTMKAIAEYFRDLAAEDRYFGAEPPTPDAAMLHKIAEREIQRRVEAKINEHGVILRADAAPDTRREIAAPVLATTQASVQDAAAQAPVAAPEPQRDAAVSDSVAAKLMRIRSAVAQSKDVADAETVPYAPAADFGAAMAGVAYVEDETEAATPPTVATVATAAAADAAFASDVDFDDAELVAEQAAIAEAEPVAVAEAEPVLLAEVEPAVVAEAPRPETADQPDADADLIAGLLAAEPVASDELAADLAEAGAVAEASGVMADSVSSQLDADEAALADLDGMDADAVIPAYDAAELDAWEDALAEPKAAATEGMEPDFIATFDIPDEDGLFDDSLLVAEPATVADEAHATDQASAAEEDTLRASLDMLFPAAVAGDAETAATAPAEDDGFDDDGLMVAEAPAEDTLRASLDMLFPADVAQPEPAAPAVVAEAPAVVLSAEDAADIALAAALSDDDLPVADDKPVVSEKAQRARARVIKIRRAAAAPAAAEAATAAQAPAAQPAMVVAATSALSPEAEADLMRELAALENALAPQPAAPQPAAVQPVAPQPAAPQPARPDTEARKQLAEATGDEAVSRLIEQTNTEMHEPENRRRLSALSHLKAAVAATVADRLTGGAKAPSEDARIDPYRNDLARVVRPRRPGASDADRPAPLVLVSAQRIDRPEPAPALAASLPTPALQVQATQPAYVRPRRVTSGNLAMESAMDDEDDDADDAENIFTDSKGFAEFADRIGAHGLPDLLEAAAAYTACVEGRPHFSRPQLIKHVNAIAPEGEYSRETGLRSFGALLRSGKIAKIKRGQFALAESSHFLTEARKIPR